ncbi:type II toxin-antitoxin system RelE family toxin [Candidatus Nitrosotenuis aquarius]|uniref:type II toxin-antitoxin system RelE family toxin n=1 Tax=Candidatus Nitrosotenuis aquarius TaxID=1846278 RepID=UPI000C1EC68D
MTWNVVWSDESLKQLKKLDTKISQRIYNYVMDCSENPFRFVIRLTNSPFYRLRVGDYRVIMDLRQNMLIIFVVDLDHRSKIYK